MKGKTIVIEGTDCSGKETQSKMLIERLNKEGNLTEYYTFPNYDKPTGEIIGLSYLGKPYLAERLIDNHSDNVIDFIEGKYGCLGTKVVMDVLEKLKEELSHGWFKEGATNVDPKVASLYYTADRMYCYPEVENLLNSGKNVVLDRYSYSNFGHQASKMKNFKDTLMMFSWLEDLEFDLAGLPESDIKIFLHMPTEYTTILKGKREEKLDEHEVDTDFLKRSEATFLEMAKMYDFSIISCIKSASLNPNLSDIKTPDEISDELYKVVKKELKLK